MKKLSLALLTMVSCTSLSTLSAESECYSSCYQPCGPTYEVYADCLYLQPNGSNLYYGAEAVPFDPSIAVPIVSPNWKSLEINPDYDFGFEIGTRIALPNSTNTKLELSWERLHAKDSKNFGVNNSNDMVGPYFDIGPNSQGYKNAHGNVHFQFDELNFNLQKTACLFDGLSTTFFGGVALARIHQTVESRFSNDAGTVAREVKSPSKYLGAGPQIGLKYDYHVYDNLFLTGNTTASIFVGVLKNNTTYKSYTPELAALRVAQPNVQKTNVRDRTQVVPSFEQKLGLSYLTNFFNCNMALEIGYQCQIYLNAVQTVDMTAPQVLPALAPFTPQTGVFAVGFERTVSNFMLSGPYASLNVQF